MSVEQTGFFRARDEMRGRKSMQDFPLRGYCPTERARMWSCHVMQNAMFEQSWTFS
jgi:hypothetical protein